MTGINNTNYFNLSQITGRIQQILQPHIGKLFWVKAEISSGREKGGSFYCDLVESNGSGGIIAQMRCTIWNRDLAKIRNRFKQHDLNLTLDDGTVVGLQCTLQFHPQFGLSLKAVDADPAFALGELELKKKEILDRLTNEGLLEPNKRQIVPMLPQIIGLVTSKGSAACNDILKTFNSSDYGFIVYLADATVQGARTENSVLTALAALEKLDIDLVIIARGGGSKTDLFYLDNEAVARRIAQFKYPVWTGIGHETDISVLDYVANQSFKTPTAVAEEIVARFVELDRHLNEARNRIKSTWTYRLDRDRRWVDDAKTGILQGTRKLLESTRSYLLGYATALSSKVQERLSNEKSRIAVSRNLITTTPTNRVKSAHERLDEKARRLISIPTRQIVDGKINLFDRQKRFQQDRFNHRILREYEYIGTRRDRLKNRFETEIKFIDQQLSHLSKRFSLAALLTYLGNEKTKLANKAAILRAAAPDTSLKRGFSLVYLIDGDLVKSVSQIQQSDILRTTVSDGQIISTVNQTERK